MMPLGPEYYKNYNIVAPLSTHWRPANSCEEIQCQNYLRGFKVTLDPSDEKFERRAYLIKTSGRKYTVEKNEAGLIEYIFPPGQDCFELPNHRVRLDIPQRYLVRENIHERPVELKYSDWQEDFAIHQDNVKRKIERG